MRKFLLSLLLAGCATIAQSAENIKIYSPYSPGHSATPALLKVVDEANNAQDVYKFSVEFKPGGGQTLALRVLDENSLGIIAPAYVDNINQGKIVESDYVPVHAFGDACWAVVTNRPLGPNQQFTVGGVGFGNASHLTALALGRKYKIDVKYVIFKSNYDALVNMTGNNGVEFVIDKYESYATLKTQNSRLNMVAASCPKRLPQAPDVKTLKEMGVDAPYIFNITVASRTMSHPRRLAIARILDTATLKVGADEIYRLGALRPPVFDGVTAEAFYKTSVNAVRTLLVQYKDKIP